MRGQEDARAGRFSRTLHVPPAGSCLLAVPSGPASLGRLGDGVETLT